MPIYAPKGACPGDTVRCSVTRVRRRKIPPERAAIQSASNLPSESSSVGYAEAIFINKLESSPISQPSPCRHFGNYKLGGGGCGGCTAMHIPYEIQLQQKQSQVEKLFANICMEDGASMHEILPCRDTLRYRNKMEFSFGRQWYMPGSKPKEKENNLSTPKEYALGLHVPQFFDKIIPIEECHLHLSVGNDILNYIRTRCTELLLEPYDIRKRIGYMRNVVIRSSTNLEGKDEVMVNLITSPCDVHQRLVPLAEEIKERFAAVVCVTQNITGVTSNHSVEVEQERLLAGNRSYIEQQLCGLKFRISANSFFQTSKMQAGELYEQVRYAARLTKQDSVLDLFCGTGTIGLCLAPYAKQIYGVDVMETAIADARVNAKMNKIENARFDVGNLEKIRNFVKGPDFGTASVIVIDPPRAGLHPDLVKFIGNCNAKRIIYVSCNPVTQARDVKQIRAIANGRFGVQSVQPIDMFPQTHHSECLVTLERQ